MEENKEKEEEEEEITITMQSSTTRGGRGDHNYNAIFRSNAAEFYLWIRQFFLSFQ